MTTRYTFFIATEDLFRCPAVRVISQEYDVVLAAHQALAMHLRFPSHDAYKETTIRYNPNHLRPTAASVLTQTESGEYTLTLHLEATEIGVADVTLIGDVHIDGISVESPIQSSDGFQTGQTSQLLLIS